MSLPPKRQIIRKRSRGANLAILAGLGAMLIGFMGISIYTGLQAGVQNEVQKVVSSAAMVGAAAYFSGPASGGAPTANPGQASSAASDTFYAMVNNSSLLKGFSPTLTNLSAVGNTVTVSANVKVPTAFLAPIGVTSIEIPATGVARALKYTPTNYVGPIRMAPDPARVGSYSAILNLAFPIVDGPGAEIVLKGASTSPYAVEACNQTECYDVTKGMIPGSGGTLSSQAGDDMITGPAAIDIGAVGVKKATKLRFSLGNLNTATPGSTATTTPTVTNADGSTTDVATTTTTAADGSTLTTTTTTTTLPDGSVTTSSTSTLVNPDGSTVTSNPDGTTSATAAPPPTPITLFDEVSIYGYAGACASAGKCALPAGFAAP